MRTKKCFQWVGGVALTAVLAGCSGGDGSAVALDGKIPRPASLDNVDPQVAQLVRKGIEIAEEEPEAALPRAGLGMIYQANEMFEPSRTAYLQALAIEPENARWLYHLSRVEERLSDVDGAIETIGRSIELEPLYAPSYWRRGSWLLNLDRADEAEADFRKAIEIAPQDPAGPSGLARTLIAQGRDEEAVSVLEKLLLDEPDDPLTHLLLGNAYRALGKAEQAERHLKLSQGERVYREDPWTANDIFRFKLSFGAQMQMAMTLAEAGEPDRAIAVFEQLREKNADDARLLRELGRTYLRVGRSEESLATLERGVELHPDDPKMLGEAATAYHMLGQSERALPLLDRAIEAKPGDGLAHARRGVILQGQKKFAEAADAYRQALVYRPQDTLLMQRYGDCFGHMQQFELAAAAYQRALTLDEDNPDLLARLAYMLHRLGRNAGAERALAKAIELKPGNPEWAKLLEQLRRTGQG